MMQQGSTSPLFLFGCSIIFSVIACPCMATRWLLQLQASQLCPRWGSHGEIIPSASTQLIRKTKASPRLPAAFLNLHCLELGDMATSSLYGCWEVLCLRKHDRREMLGLDQIAIHHQGWGTAVANGFGALSLRARKMGRIPVVQDNYE